MGTAIGTATMITINDGEPMPGSFAVEVAVIDYQSDTASKPDMAWTAVDDAGHFHAYATDGELPTLAARTRHVDCDGVHAGPVLDDVCDGYDVVDWHCRICGQEVQPERVPDRGPKQMPGRKHWHAEVVTSREITEDAVSVRIQQGGKLRFGVARPVLVSMESDGPNGVRVATRLHGDGPLGERSS
ncbi:hypothetical protein [Actinoplanes teichomyceticus]|uniref:Uncharacterized protein n=1 Tax=Actinoplanes teichomyceticus TaxID=1867 RepID=A0A561WAV5_ACTTI|nr:hypothetical protein [Actinoplanes teichomyceticus]TWG20983.1 hypothetical protein FHX34_103512 [Actinoplanes teichomyceticus]GIF14802.1 hypothetical protein Ate01nite_48340 [Actinoplanes teichomyceticus]